MYSWHMISVFRYQILLKRWIDCIQWKIMRSTKELERQHSLNQFLFTWYFESPFFKVMWILCYLFWNQYLTILSDVILGFYCLWIINGFRPEVLWKEGNCFKSQSISKMCIFEWLFHVDCRDRIVVLFHNPWSTISELGRHITQ